MPVSVSPNALTTLTNLKTFFADLNLGVPHDELLQIAINAVSQKAETYTSRTLKAKAITAELQDGSGASLLQLGQYPINSVTSVTDTRNGQVFEASKYVIGAPTGVLYLKDSTWERVGYPYLSITYNAGYQVIPADLEWAAIKWAALEWAGRDTERLGVVSKAFAEGGTITYDKQGVPQDIKVIFDRYRRLV